MTCKLRIQVQHRRLTVRPVSLCEPINHRKIILRLLVALVWGVSALKISANGFGLPDQDAFATARGEAFVATADNASAIYYNPAGITQLTGNNVRGGLNSVYYDPTYQQANGGKTYHNSDNYAFLPQLFYTYTATGAPLSFGLGIYAPYGGNIRWPQDTGFRSVAIGGSLKYITINPVVAVKLLPGLSVGGGVMINYADLHMNQGLLPLAPRSTNFFKFTGDGWSVGYNVGVLWQPHEKISLGATFRSSARMNFQGNTDFELEPGAYNTPAHRAASSSFDFPQPPSSASLIGPRPNGIWNLTRTTRAGTVLTRSPSSSHRRRW